jgi:hypothetical protein
MPRSENAWPEIGARTASGGKLTVRKRRFIQRLLNERDDFELLLNQLGFEKLLTMAGVAGSWSVKDIIAHIMAYEQYTADRLSEAAHGERYIPCATQSALESFCEKFGYPDFGSSLLDDDGPNAWIVDKYKNIPLEELVTLEIHAFATIIAGLEALPDDVLFKQHLLELVARNTSEHYREHRADIVAWLAK